MRMSCIHHYRFIQNSFKDVYFKPHTFGYWAYDFKVESLSIVVDYSRRDFPGLGEKSTLDYINLSLPLKQAYFVVVVYNFRISGLEGTLRVVKHSHLSDIWTLGLPSFPKSQRTRSAPGNFASLSQVGPWQLSSLLLRVRRGPLLL